MHYLQPVMGFLYSRVHTKHVCTCDHLRPYIGFLASNSLENVHAEICAKLRRTRCRRRTMMSQYDSACADSVNTSMARAEAEPADIEAGGTDALHPLFNANDGTTMSKTTMNTRTAEIK